MLAKQTKKASRNQTPDKDRFEWDDKEPGLGVRFRTGRNPTWYLQTRIEGKTVRRSLGLLSDFSLADAREIAREARDELSGAAPAPVPVPEISKATVTDFSEQFLKDGAPNWKPATIKAHRYVISRFIVPAFGTRDLASLTAAWLFLLKAVVAEENCSCDAGLGPEEVAVEADEDDLSKLYIAGIFDMDSYDWGPDIFQLTVDLIHQGWWDALPSASGGNNNLQLEYSLANSNCDSTNATRAYWKLRTANNHRPMHGIVGARCSGASASLARISEGDGVPQVSPASNAAELSDDVRFPFFSRLVAPTNEYGAVGAFVAMLRAFGWTKITTLGTGGFLKAI